jgi:hypothetical protein
VLSNTQNVTRWLHLFNQKLASAVLRARPSDRLSLKLLQWLHSAHPQTRELPAGISDGEFGIWPAPPLPTIYFMPCSAPLGLLYLPLFFHEFGHLLYVCHKPEMDALVRGLQGAVAAFLEPNAHRDDLHDRVERARRLSVAETWYSWAQEVFCDAVGFTIGGPSFLHAFCLYLRMRGRGEYHIPADQLTDREHPVTWLRARLLADRAARAGHAELARAFANAWELTSAAMGVVEDYYGFFEPEFQREIQQTIDDMLTESEPRRFTDHEAAGSGSLSASSPIHLLNQAWNKFREDAQRYPSWEDAAVAAFLEE